MCRDLTAEHASRGGVRENKHGKHPISRPVVHDQRAHRWLQPRPIEGCVCLISAVLECRDNLRDGNRLANGLRRSHQRRKTRSGRDEDREEPTHAPTFEPDGGAIHVQLEHGVHAFADACARAPTASVNASALHPFATMCTVSFFAGCAVVSWRVTESRLAVCTGCPPRNT